MNDALRWRDALKAAGGADALAASLGIARRTLFKWRAEGVPADRLADFATATGIAPADLRPDLARVFERGDA
jgi:DNA-binding transcriptional regulator YdaS (Cro superfamily)